MPRGGARPGLLVPPEDTAALAGALRCWLTEPALRDRLNRSAGLRRTTLTGWSVTARLISNALCSNALCSNPLCSNPLCSNPLCSNPLCSDRLCRQLEVTR